MIQVTSEILADNLPFISLARNVSKSKSLFAIPSERDSPYFKNVPMWEACETEFCLKIPEVGKAWLRN